MAQQNETQVVVETSRRAEIVTAPDADGTVTSTVTLFATIEGVEYRVYAYGVGLKNRKLAVRMADAWSAKAVGGKLFLHTRTDAEVIARAGLLYATVENMPLGRHLSADLKKVGF